MAEIKIVWDLQAKNSFKKHLDYIRKESLQSAERVRNDILGIIGNLGKYPEKFPPDKFKKDNDGSYRAFERNNCRIAYYITESQIRILRVRHVKQEPRKY